MDEVYEVTELEPVVWIPKSEIERFKAGGPWMTSVEVIEDAVQE